MFSGLRGVFWAPGRQHEKSGYALKAKESKMLRAAEESLKNLDEFGVAFYLLKMSTIMHVLGFRYLGKAIGHLLYQNRSV